MSVFLAIARFWQPGNAGNTGLRKSAAPSEGWLWFENHQTEFKKIRDKQLAHLDTSKAGSDYVLTPVSGPDWKTVKEAIDRLVELAKLLLTVLHRLDESFDQFRESAKRDASGFWR